MGKFTREEILTAFENYKRARDAASKSGDWRVWAAVFCEDAHYIEHAYGEFVGRAAIERWIVDVMAPFPVMTFPQDWWVLDAARDAIVFCCQNTFPEPLRSDGTPFAFPSWTRLVYGGGGLWKSEEDIYNPARDAPRIFQEWLAAGGHLRTPERVTMQHK